VTAAARLAGAQTAAPSPSPSPAPAEVEGTSPSQATSAAAEPGRFLPGALTPEAGGARALGFGWAGYDGASSAPLVGAAAEVRLGSRVVLQASAIWAKANDLQSGEVRPSVVARVQVLDQRRAGVDAGFAVAYREDRFVGEDGFFQGTVMVGRRGSAGTLLANVAYGQDGEGDDHEGEVRLAALSRLTDSLHLGVDADVRKSLDSTDPRRFVHGSPSVAYMVGPTLAYGLGSWGFTAQAGWSGMQLERFQSGLLALGGVGALF
jgi:hypothetical protein